MSKITIDTTNLSFATIQLLVAIRDNYRCQIHRLLDSPSCPNNNIETHHIISVKNNGSDEPENLISLCEKHHRLMHGLADGQQIKKQILQLKLIMLENNITQTQLAAALNVSQSAIAQSLQKQTSTFSRAMKIKNYLQARTGKTYILEDLFQVIDVKKRT